MKGLFPDDEPKPDVWFETPEYGRIDTTGYQCRWDRLTLSFIVSPPEGEIMYSHEFMDSLEKHLQFGNREQINALKAWAICSAMPVERMRPKYR